MRIPKLHVFYRKIASQAWHHEKGNGVNPLKPDLGLVLWRQADNNGKQSQLRFAESLPSSVATAAVTITIFP